MVGLGGVKGSERMLMDLPSPSVVPFCKFGGGELEFYILLDRKALEPPGPVGAVKTKNVQLPGRVGLLSPIPPGRQLLCTCGAVPVAGRGGLGDLPQGSLLTGQARPVGSSAGRLLWCWVVGKMGWVAPGGQGRARCRGGKGHTTSSPVSFLLEALLCSLWAGGSTLSFHFTNKPAEAPKVKAIPEGLAAALGS